MSFFKDLFKALEIAVLVATGAEFLGAEGFIADIGIGGETSLFIDSGGAGASAGPKILGQGNVAEAVATNAGGGFTLGQTLGILSIANQVIGFGTGAAAIAVNQELTSRRVNNTLTEGEMSAMLEQKVNIPILQDNIAIIDASRSLQRNREKRDLRTTLSRIRASQSQSGFASGNELVGSALTKGELDILVGDSNAEIQKLNQFRQIDKSNRASETFLRRSKNQAGELQLAGNIRSARIGTELILQPAQKLLTNTVLSKPSGTN